MFLCEITYTVLFTSLHILIRTGLFDRQDAKVCKALFAETSKRKILFVSRSVAFK